MKKTLQRKNILQKYFGFDQSKQVVQKGFTLLETMVAIFILTLSLTGPVYIASVAFRNTIDSRDNISAQYIAEEVIEVIRNKRDKKMLTDVNGTEWLAGITGTALCSNEPGSSAKRCMMSRESDGDYFFEQCVDGECGRISFDPSGLNQDAVYGKEGILTYSKFTREFYYETVGVGEIKLIVNIKWQDKGRPKIYTLTERLHAIEYRGFFKVDSTVR